MTDDSQKALQEAREAMERGDPIHAADILHAAAAAEPGAWEIQEFLGAALCASGNLEGGIDAFQQVVDLRPTNPLAHFNLASALRRAGQYEVAARHLGVALRLDPRYERALAAQAEWAREDAARRQAEDFARQQAEDLARQQAEDGARQQAPETPAEPTSSGALSQPPGSAGAPTEDKVAPAFNPPADESAAAAAPGTDGAPPQAEGTPPPSEVTSLPERFEPGAAPPTAPAIPLWEATPANVTPGLDPGAGAYTPAGIPPPGGAKPRATINDLPVKHEDDIPTLGQLFLDTIIAPRDALTTVLPAIAGAPEGVTALVVPFLIAAIIWGCSQVLQPGAASPLSAASLLIQLPLSILVPFVLIGGQALVATIMVGMLQHPSPPGAFRDLALRFGFVWGVTNLVCLGAALIAYCIGLVMGTYFGAIPIAIYIALIWSFVLNVLALRALFTLDFVRSLLIALLASAVGDALALALMEAIRLIRIG